METNSESMATARKIPWKRISAEAAMIVVSILLALWIEAWWANKEDRKDERLVLNALVREFRELRTRLDWDKTYNEAIRDSIRELTSAAVGPESTLGDEDIDRLIADLLWNQGISSWTAPELTSVISSGDLALITNFALRHRLGTSLTLLQGVRDVKQRDLDFYANWQMPFLVQHTSLAQILNAIDGAPGREEWKYDSGRKIVLKRSVSHAHLLADPVFQNLLLERDILITDLLTEAFAGLGEDLDETIGLLEQELGLLPKQ